MPILLALLSLLGGCSGMLDLPDQPRVTSESAAPLQPPARSGGSREWHAWGAQPGGASPSDVKAPRLADAGTLDDADSDAGSAVRLSSR